MMKRFDLYGDTARSLAEVAEVLSSALGIRFEMHDSSYLGGEYWRSTSDKVEEVLIQDNYEDEEGYLAEADFANYPTLVYVTGPADPVTEALEQDCGLILLRTELL